MLNINEIQKMLLDYFQWMLDFNNLSKCDGLNSSLVLILHVFISNTNYYMLKHVKQRPDSDTNATDLSKDVANICNICGQL